MPDSTPFESDEDVKPQIPDLVNLFEDDDPDEDIDELASSEIQEEEEEEPGNDDQIFAADKYIGKLPVDIQLSLLDSKCIKSHFYSAYGAIGIAADWENPLSPSLVRTKLLNELNGIDQDGIDPTEAASWTTYLNSQHQLRQVNFNAHQVLIALITTSTDHTYCFNPFAMGALVSETFNKVFIVFDTINTRNSMTFIPGSFVDKDPDHWDLQKEALCVALVWNGKENVWIAVKLRDDNFALPFVWDKDLVGLEKWRLCFKARGVWKDGKSWDYSY